MKFLRRYGLSLYFLFFAAFAALQGRYAGLAPHGDEIGYQWGAVFFVWFALAISVAILHRIIDPKNYSMSSPRFGKALGFSVLLIIVFFALLESPGVPPVLGVPMFFAIVTAVLTLIFGVAEAISNESRDRKAPK